MLSGRLSTIKPIQRKRQYSRFSLYDLHSLQGMVQVPLNMTMMHIRSGSCICDMTQLTSLSSVATDFLPDPSHHTREQLRVCASLCSKTKTKQERVLRPPTSKLLGRSWNPWPHGSMSSDTDLKCSPNKTHCILLVSFFQVVSSNILNGS